MHSGDEKRAKAKTQGRQNLGVGVGPGKKGQRKRRRRKSKTPGRNQQWGHWLEKRGHICCVNIFEVFLWKRD